MENVPNELIVEILKFQMKNSNEVYLMSLLSSYCIYKWKLFNNRKISVSYFIKSFELIKYGTQINFMFYHNVCRYCVKFNNLKMLKKVIKNSYYMNTNDIYLFKNAIANGNLEMLNWALKNGCSMDNNLFIDAISNNKHEVLQWMCLNGFTIDEEFMILFG